MGSGVTLLFTLMVLINELIHLLYPFVHRRKQRHRNYQIDLNRGMSIFQVAMLCPDTLSPWYYFITAAVVCHANGNRALSAGPGTRDHAAINDLIGLPSV